MKKNRVPNSLWIFHPWEIHVLNIGGICPIDKWFGLNISIAWVFYQFRVGFRAERTFTFTETAAPTFWLCFRICDRCFLNPPRNILSELLLLKNQFAHIIQKGTDINTFEYLLIASRSPRCQYLRVFIDIPNMSILTIIY